MHVYAFLSKCVRACMKGRLADRWRAFVLIVLQLHVKEKPRQNSACSAAVYFVPFSKRPWPFKSSYA